MPSLTNPLSNADGADPVAQKIRWRRLSRDLLDWVLLRLPGLRRRLTRSGAAAKSSILDAGDHVYDIKIGLQILNLTVMFDFKLLD